MRMKRLLCALTALLLAGSSVWADGAATPSTRIRTAKAFAPDDGRHLYSERHEERWEGSTHASSLVEYRAADGRLLARKTLRFDASATLPAFAFEDLRTGAEEGADWVDGKLEVRRREDRAGQVERAVLDLPAPAVMDAGFDHAIQLHWKTLVAGEALEFSFAVPSKLDYFRLRLEWRGVISRGDRRLLELRMEPASTLLGWLVDPVLLRYDLATRALVEYEGRSNIRDDAGELQVVRIVFEDLVTAASLQVPTARSRGEGRP